MVVGWHILILLDKFVCRSPPQSGSPATRSQHITAYLLSVLVVVLKQIGPMLKVAATALTVSPLLQSIPRLHDRAFPVTRSCPLCSRRHTTTSLSSVDSSTQDKFRRAFDRLQRSLLPVSILPFSTRLTFP